jgi:signal transduction histidine kinase
MDVHSEGERRLLHTLLAAEARERARLADALHDDTIGALTAASFAVWRVAQQTDLPDLDLASQLLSDAIDGARRLMFDLSPMLLREFGLVAAIESLCLQASARGRFELELDLTEERFRPAVEELVYRTVREAVLNARQHSGGKRLRVGVARDGDEVRGVVEDDGVGFDPAAARSEPGLRALAARLAVVRGWLAIETAPGSGTRVRFGLPLS